MKLTKPFSPSIALFSVAASLGVATVISSAAPASAMSGPVTLNFGCGTPQQSAAACNIGASQFSAVVSPVGTNQALFTFTNTGLINNSSITDISIFVKPQFSLASVASTNNGMGVNFVPTVSTGSQFFTLSSGGLNNSPIVAINNGINPGQSLGVLFNIAPGFNKPFNAVATSLLKGRITVQYQAAGFNFQQTGLQYTTKTPFFSKVKAVPEPFTMLGSAAALGFGALMKRRSSQLKAQKGGNKPVLATCETLV
jgi:hypothetical protein